ncbi:tryptophan synthase subunit alpha [Actinomadura sp. ATCC 31491]|uniref:Tryptophan synthase alpha chain n=1 Tax=Actinomadura luzonensis TaxID=2805427 RepID=A0ABT0FTJ5_9ACTN|nr:tryptophan synthase subunit alpha [Actinomadura luzonensis]MCK2215666.1 tryptophan synthase subunit alpha [Actinomadura luzonensis]
MTNALAPGAVERHLRARRDAGRRLLMPYITGGVTPGWTDYLRAFAEAGADAVELGLPFSDPTLDGVTIQRASEAALARGVSTRRILAELAEAPHPGVPLVASTYYNLVLHDGPEAFCAALRRAGVAGLIVPDLPVHEADELADAAAAAGIDLALLASPATPQARLAEIARRSRGFVYAVSVMGTTGERAALAASAAELAARLRHGTDRPILLGFGISTPDQAREGGRHADGVVVGAAVMRRVLDGAGPDDLRAFIATLRRALDQE